MNLMDLELQIRNNQLSNVYLFIAEDVGVTDIFIDKIHKAYDGDIIRSDKLLDVWGNLTQRSLFEAKERNIYIVRDDNTLPKQPKLWGKFAESVVNGILILVYTDLLKTSKMYKDLEECRVTFTHMTDKQLTKYIKNRLLDHINVDDDVAKYLAEACREDLARIDNEVDKILLLNTRDYWDMYEVIDTLVYNVPDFNVFAFIDDILTKAYNFVVGDLNVVERPNSGINRMGILTLLYNRFYDAAKVMGNPWDKSVEERTGVKYMAAKKIWTICKYKHESCLTALRIIQDAESGIKQGRYIEGQAVTNCILNILMLK